MAARHPDNLSLIPALQQEGKKIRGKGSWVMIKADKSLIIYYHAETDLTQESELLLQIKIDLDSEKCRQKDSINTLLLLLLPQFHCFIPGFTPHLPPQRDRGMEQWGQSIRTPLCFSFTPCCSSSPGLIVHGLHPHDLAPLDTVNRLKVKPDVILTPQKSWLNLAESDSRQKSLQPFQEEKNPKTFH